MPSANGADDYVKGRQAPGKGAGEDPGQQVVQVLEQEARHRHFAHVGDVLQHLAIEVEHDVRQHLRQDALQKLLGVHVQQAFAHLVDQGGRGADLPHEQRVERVLVPLQQLCA